MKTRPTLLLVLAGCTSADRADLPEADTGSAARLSSGAWQFATNVHPASVDAADLNGDGRLDLVLGREGSPGGAVLVFLAKASGPRFLATPDAQFNVNETSSHLGEEQLALGDFNCDGNIDAAVGVHGATAGQTAEGHVFVYTGNGDGTFADRSANPTPTWVLQPDVTNEYVGVHLAAYDANHDGCTDLLVPGTVQLRGALGAPTGLTFTATWSLGGYQPDAEPVGDLNGDGHEDFAWWESSYGSGAGQVVVFLGTGTGFPGPSHRSLVGAGSAQLGGYLNASGVTAGDLDRDGYDDLVVGAPGGNGRVDIYRGGVAGVSASPTWSLSGPNDGISGAYGTTVVSGFDQNGDGYDDLLIGEPIRDFATRGNRGRWWLVAGSSAGPVNANPELWISDRENKLGAYGRYGWSFGDLDDDGYDDVVLEDIGLTTLWAVDAETQLLTGGPDVDTDGDGFLDPVDCASTNPAIHPGATELYGNLVDEDCNGTDDCLADTDQDNYGSKVVVANKSGGCSAPDREAAIGGDCNDNNASVRPGGSESIADGVDGDCNGGDLCYVDADKDTYGSGLTATSPDASCGHPGLASGGGDCDDKRPMTYPGALELIINGVDDDCDGLEACGLDKDGDGHGRIGETYLTSDLKCKSFPATTVRDDCDDNNGKVYPGSGEQPADGFDGNCDGVESCWLDADGDGHGANTNTQVMSTDLSCKHPGLSYDTADCNDKVIAIYPGAVEQPMDGVDQDCDGTELCPADKDGDGHADPIINVPYPSLSCTTKLGVPVRDDCDDGQDEVHPGALESAASGRDEDCDGFELCFPDADGDTWGTYSGTLVASTNLACDSPGSSQHGKDCNDANALAWPGAPEIPADGVDENCDGFEECYIDYDGDGWGQPFAQTSKSPSCTGPNDATRGGDCDDKHSAVNPDAIDVPHDGVDQNCDKSDLCLRDTDGDGYGGTNTLDNGDSDCDDPGEAGLGGDCDDLTVDAYPGAPDAINDGVDSDCDGLDSCYVDRDGDGAGGTATAPGPFGCKGSGVAPLPNDCDDLLTTAHPGGTDLPGDAIDQDCDGKLTCFVDADGDGSGGTSVAEGSSCSSPGLAPDDDDCNDKQATIHPGATEIGGDGVDQDCTGLDGCYLDLDGDLFGSTEVAANGKACGTLAVVGGDCDDTDRDVSPGDAEVVGDPADNDCDGYATCYTDADHDEWGGAELLVQGGGPNAPVDCTLLGRAPVGGDCDDETFPVHPDATDQLGWDTNCDGVTTCFEDRDGDDFGGAVIELEVAPGDDVDCAANGFAPIDGDCDDSEPTANPGGFEVAGDAIDQDCDGTRDCFVDSDGDGVGTSTIIATDAATCAADGVAAVDGDCHDLNAAMSPAAIEICDGLDNNCNGRPDEGYPWVDLADPEGTCENTHIPLCGCTSGSGTGAGGLGAVLAFVFARRRRARNASDAGVPASLNNR